MSHRIPPSLDEADGFLPVEVKRWYVVRVAPRRGLQALEKLQEWGARAYHPTATEWKEPNKPHKDDADKRVVSLMPGYLFAELTDEHIAEQLPEYKFMMDLVRFEGSEPRPLGPLDVRKLAWMAYFESQGAFDYTWSPKPKRWNPKRGETARIASGPYSGFSGKITELRGKNRITIMGEWFGIRRPVTVPVVEAELSEAA